MTDDKATAPCDPAMAKRLRGLVPRSRQRAGRAGRAQLAHDFPADHAEQLFQQQHGSCAISGLPFSLSEFAGVLVKHPLAPSLDRISSQGGYTADNVRLVCVAVDFGMGQWGEGLYLTFARAAVERSNRTNGPTSTPADAFLPNTSLPSAEEAGAAARSSLQRERIAAAETIASTLSEEPLIRQQRQIASLRRNLTLGPAGLKAAAAKSVRTCNV